jgi:hypothetical protein
MHDKQNSALYGVANADIPFFKVGMPFVGKGDKERIKEEALGLLETNSVLVFIPSSFPGIPLKYEFHFVFSHNLGYHIVELVTTYSSNVFGNAHHTGVM